MFTNLHLDETLKEMSKQVSIYCQYHNFDITRYDKYHKCFRTEQCNKWKLLIFLILESIWGRIDRLFQGNYSAMSHLYMCLHTSIYTGFQATSKTSIQKNLLFQFFLFNLFCCFANGFFYGLLNSKENIFFDALTPKNLEHQFNVFLSNIF